MPPSPPSSSLAPSYVQARDRFLRAAKDAGARVDSYVHPELGLEGEELAIDVAELGPADADDVVLVVSGTHGVEGYCGSALQSDWLERATPERPDAVAVVLVHALNPFGFSWVKRTNEDNVDLNRNFIDWSATPPATPDYDEIADLLVPEQWTEPERERTDTALLTMLAERGLEQFQQTISRGQYGRRDGVFYGGTAPAWSHRWLRRWTAERLGTARRLAVLDIHTGLGPWGHGELISGASVGDPEHDRASSWWDQVTSMGADSVSADLHGDWLQAAPDLLPSVEVTGVAIEYGTIDPVSVLQALRADAWLHCHGDPTGSSADEVRAQLRAAFADDDPAWFDAVRGRFHQVLGQTFAALGT